LLKNNCKVPIPSLQSCATLKIDKKLWIFSILQRVQKFAKSLWLFLILQFVHKRYIASRKYSKIWHISTSLNIFLILIVELLFSLFRKIMYKQPSLKALNPLARQPLPLNSFFLINMSLNKSFFRLFIPLDRQQLPLIFFSSKFSFCEALISNRLLNFPLWVRLFLV